MLDICHQGGFEVLIQKTPFSTYGHYNWNEAFAPRGDQSVEEMVAKAEKAGVRLGVMVQENAVGTDDAFFSPEFFKQYRKEGRVELYCAILEDETTIALRRNEMLKTPSALNLIMIDEELISYATLEFSGDLVLVHRCMRGAYGTKASSHDVTAEAYRIWDSPGQYVEPEGDLRVLVQQRLENKLLFFPVIMYQGDANRNMIDVTTRVSQVESWEKESTLSSLGLFLIRARDKRNAGTSMEELEWMLSKAVAFGTCYGLMIDPQAMTSHGMLGEMLTTASRWNRLLRSGRLTASQKKQLSDPYLDWHLEVLDSVCYLLHPQNISRRYRCSLEETDPGMFRSETWTWNSVDGGPFGLQIQVDGETEILNPMVNTSRGLVMFPCRLGPGQRLMYDFGETACIIDADYNKLEEITIEGLAEFERGSNEVYLLCEADPTSKQSPVVTLRFITREQAMVAHPN